MRRTRRAADQSLAITPEAPDLGTRDGRCNHITFVQVHTASLAWAPFTEAATRSGGFSVRVLGPDTTVVETNKE